MDYNTDKYAQAYFEYDAKKSFGVTKSHLRFSDKPIANSQYVKQADFVACHNSSYLYKYDMVQDVKPSGFFLLNCVWNDEELSRLDSHIRQAYKLMDGDEPCGSKLNFLVQEMNREVNTIGSKAMDADIAKMVVDGKSEIEKLREQIQNVE